MELGKYTPEMVGKKEISTNVDPKSNNDYMSKMLQNKTKNFTFMTFDGFRIALGKNNGWGTKVFFDTMEEMNILCKTPDGATVTFPDGKDRITTSAYSPCPPQPNRDLSALFVYNYDNNIWGFDGNKLDLFSEDILSEMENIANELREMYTQEDRIRKQLSYLKTKRKSRKSGGIDGDDSK